MKQIAGIPQTSTMRADAAPSQSLLLPIKPPSNGANSIFDIGGNRYLSRSPLPEGVSQWLARLPVGNGNGVSQFLTVLGLGPALTLALPPSLSELIQRKGVDQQRLLMLARQGSGYLLGETVVNQNKLCFASLPKLPLPTSSSVNDGRYRARITLGLNGLTLALDPIKFEAELELATPADAPKAQHSQIGGKHQEAMLAALQRKLLNPQSAAASPIKSLSEQAAITHDAPTPLDDDNLVTHPTDSPQARLGRALERTGAFSPHAEHVTPLVTSLVRLMSLLQPKTVDTLMHPDILKRALLSSADPRLYPAQGESATTPNNSPLAMLFQLLLGGVQRQFGLAPSLLLKTWLNELGKNTQFSFDDAINDKAPELARDVSALADARRELLQLGQAKDGWFFCLPYLFGDRQRSFEGHWQRSPSQQETLTPLWQLTLRFSLSDADLLVEVKRDTTGLALRLISSSAPLTARIDNFTPVLKQHLSTLGFGENRISTQTGKVPVTLLPNGFEHMKVKV